MSDDAKECVAALLMGALLVIPPLYLLCIPDSPVVGDGLVLAKRFEAEHDVVYFEDSELDKRRVPDSWIITVEGRDGRGRRRVQEVCVAKEVYEAADEGRRVTLK